MAHFSKLNSSNIVENVVVVDNSQILDSEGNESEALGVEYLQGLFGSNTTWKQTSYNKNFRGNYGGCDTVYIENVATLGVGSTDIFIQQQPHPSWTINTSEPVWEPPVVRPGLTTSQLDAGNYYVWNEVAYQADNSDPNVWVLRDPPPVL